MVIPTALLLLPNIWFSLLLSIWESEWQFPVLLKLGMSMWLVLTEEMWVEVFYVNSKWEHFIVTVGDSLFYFSGPAVVELVLIWRVHMIEAASHSLWWLPLSRLPHNSRKLVEPSHHIHTPGGMKNEEPINGVNPPVSPTTGLCAHSLGSPLSQAPGSRTLWAQHIAAPSRTGPLWPRKKVKWKSDM